MSRERLALSCLAAGAAVWLAATIAAPLLATSHPTVAGVLYAIYDRVCHQIPERSFHLAGHPLAVCHRCSGLYLGGLLGLLAMPRLPRVGAVIAGEAKWIVLLGLPLVVDWALWGEWPWLRTATGVLAAFPIAALVQAAVQQLARREPHEQETTA